MDYLKIFGQTKKKRSFASQPSFHQSDNSSLRTAQERGKIILLKMTDKPIKFKTAEIMKRY